MPRMTAGYGFEFKVFHFADDLSLRLTGAHRAFVRMLGEFARDAAGLEPPMTFPCWVVQTLSMTLLGGRTSW